MTKTILIGIDGCCFDVLNPLIMDGKLPTLEEIISNGYHGILHSTIPPKTIPAWTSIFTGVNPGKHGVIDSPLRVDGEIRVVTSKDRMVSTLWTILSAFNIKQIVVNEPVTYPPEEISGIMLTGFSTPPSAQNYIYPYELKREVDRACGGYMPDLEPNLDDIIAKDRNRGLEMIDDFAKRTFRAAIYLANNYEWNLLSCTFTSTDRLQHFYFDDHDAISSHYRLIDRMIAEIMDITEANVIIVSDHGFGPLRRFFYINTLLKKLNYLRVKRTLINRLLLSLGLDYRKLASLLVKAKLYEVAARLTPKRIKQSVPTDTSEQAIDYRRSFFYSVSLNGGIYVNNTAIGSPALLSNLIEVLRSLVVDHERPIERVFSRQEVLWGDFIDRAPEIMFLPSYGYEISPRISQSILEFPRASGDIRTGTHRLEGIFLAFGPDIKRGRLKCPVQTWDIAPTILHELNLPIPDYMDGRVLKEIFKEGSDISARSVKTIKWGAKWWLKEKIRRIRSRKI